MTARPLGERLRRALDLFGLERRCFACAAVFESRRDVRPSLFCPACTELMPRRTSGFCPLCGELAAWPALPAALCGHCLKERPPWLAFFFHGPHEALLRTLLIKLKFGESPLLGHALGTLISLHPGLPGLDADVVTPVPLHESRLIARGYNQALEIAKPLAARLALPLEPGLVTRIRATPPQTGASRAARRGNTQRAFLAAETVRGAHVLLVDDTLTTGATTAETAHTLLRAGARLVSVAVVSRTPLHYRGK